MRVKIGLETHVQVNSLSKLLCGCHNPVHKEAAENTLTCPTCLGLPGAKPRVNERVLEQGLKVVFALGCVIPKEMFFSRKAYFYPDMSKNFQITQFEVPLGERGVIEVAGKRVRIRRVHIEEDPARLVHVGGIGGKTLVDYNRAGTPLLEIVTEPDFSSPQEARLYLQKLELILEYLGVYSSTSRAILKSDANISLSVKGEQGARVEVKNITGTKEIEQALKFEIIRQEALLIRGQTVARETRGWNVELGSTQEMRGKEGEAEYGYIFEPDLTRIELSNQVKQKVRKGLPELPDQRFSRLVKRYKLPAAMAEAIVSDLDLANLFESLAQKGNAKMAGSWVAGYLKKTLNYHELSFKESGVKKEWMSHLLGLLRNGQITDRNAELTIRKMVAQKKHPREIVKEEDYLVKRFDVDILLRRLIEKQKKAVKDYRMGEGKALNFLVGEAMRETKGSVDAQILRKALERLLKA